jgi:diguanylate cyclase
LRDLPAEELKLDRSFVARLTDDRVRTILAATIRLADELGLRFVAEGIETEDELTALREMGCRVGQGYAFLRPEPASVIDGWIASQRRQESVTHA